MGKFQKTAIGDGDYQSLTGASQPHMMTDAFNNLPAAPRLWSRWQSSGRGRCFRLWYGSGAVVCPRCHRSFGSLGIEGAEPFNRRTSAQGGYGEMLEFQTGRDARMAVRIARRAASAAPIAATFATRRRAFLRTCFAGEEAENAGRLRIRGRKPCRFIDLRIMPEPPFFQGFAYSQEGSMARQSAFPHPR